MRNDQRSRIQFLTQGRHLCVLLKGTWKWNPKKETFHFNDSTIWSCPVGSWPPGRHNMTHRHFPSPPEDSLGQHPLALTSALGAATWTRSSSRVPFFCSLFWNLPTKKGARKGTTGGPSGIPCEDCDASGRLLGRLASRPNGPQVKECPEMISKLLVSLSRKGITLKRTHRI